MLAATLLLLPSCSSSHDDAGITEPEYSDDMPMNFTSSVGIPITRAATLLHDNKYVNFGVWAWKKPYGSTKWLDVMPHYRVSYDTKYVGEGRSENGWGYDKEEDSPYNKQILKYWDLGTKEYDFQGYAPFTNATGTDPRVVVLEGTRDLHFKNVNGFFPAANCQTVYPKSTDPEYNTLKNNIDWVYCYSKRTFSPLPDLGVGEKFDKDMTIDPPNGEYFGDAISKTNTQPLRFHHLLPKVIFRIHVYDPDNLDHEQLVNIGIDVKANTVKATADIQYDEVETYGTSGNTNVSDQEYVDHNPPGTCPIPASASPTVISFHKEKNTHYRDLSPSLITTDSGTGVVTYDKQGWMLVPQEAPEFTINLRADGTDYYKTLNPALDSTLPSNWESDHIYIYIIQFNVKTKTLDTTSYTEDWEEFSDTFDITDW